MLELELFKDIKSDWLLFFENEKNKEYFSSLLKNLKKEYENYVCYPKINDIFKLFKTISIHNIKVVIFGQDPYHCENQANGLAFSVNPNMKLPPSLKNIFKELKNDLNIIKDNGDLSSWVNQGIFLCNCILTVRKNSPNSHQNLGWNNFTLSLIQYLNIQKKDIIYVLWGKKAQAYKKFIHSQNIIISAHPSPFSYHKFVNSKPFSKINNILINNNDLPINWE